MSNMSYCRFQNTASDLSDCHAALEELLTNGVGKLSRDELAAAKQLVALCGEVVQLMADTAGTDVDAVIDDENVTCDTLDEYNDDAEQEA